MNLKHFYYRGYFDGIIQKTPPEKGSQVEKNTEKAFREKNHRLTITQGVNPFDSTSIQLISGLQALRLQVQNPGLLPGIGYPHEVGYPGEFKLGFGFDHVTGLPVLPGSSVKGVLRSVFPQMKVDPENPLRWAENPDDRQKAKSKYILELIERLELDTPNEMKSDGGLRLAHALELAIFCGRDVSNFYAEGAKWPLLSMNRHDVFFDALPVKFDRDRLLGRDALTPHGDNPLKNPIPLPFVKVMPNVEFGFWFRLHETRIGSLTITAEQKRRIFSEILCTVGAGAKTNVGYGQFESINVSDRIPRPKKNTAATSAIATAKAEVQSRYVEQTAIARPRQLPFNKSLKGKKVAGEVVSIGVGAVRFRLPEVTGFEGEVEIKVADSLLDRFQAGKKFELQVSDVLPERKQIVAKISSFIAL